MKLDDVAFCKEHAFIYFYPESRTSRTVEASFEISKWPKYEWTWYSVTRNKINNFKITKKQKKGPGANKQKPETVSYKNWWKSPEFSQ